jgi:hypothetical protein
MTMFSPALRMASYVLAGFYAGLGAILFAAPTLVSGNFAWRVSPMVTMTIGGWCLGNAWGAFVCARRANWAAMTGTALYLGLFGLMQSGVVLAFRDRLLLANPLTWLYLATLALSWGFAAIALADWWRQPRAPEPQGRRPVLLERVYLVLFILFVGFLGIYGLTAAEGMRGLNAAIFPEQLTPLSLRAFGVFYLALALSTVPLLFARGVAPGLNHAYAFMGLIVFITIAALVFIRQFDFAARLTQLIYLGVYLIVGLINGAYLLRLGTGRDHG